MKTIFIFLGIIGLFLSSKLPSPSSVYLPAKEVAIDSLPDSLFYGLTAQQITKMPNTKIKAFCSQKNISLSKFVIKRTQAESYLLKEQIKHDSIETVRIYEQTDKLLGIDK